MPEIDFDLARYIAERRGADDARLRAGAAYAYPGDQKVLRTLSRMTPVTLATSATVRLFKNFAKSEILGTSVKVTDKQFAEIYTLARDCADRLQIAMPTIYVAPEVGTLNAHTFGTNDDAFIVLNGVLVDHLSPDELKFVLGHECGHIQNNHTVYITALYYLMYSANEFVRWIVKPAVLALQSWARRAEITCDRAGLICCGDLEVSQRALVKLALGSQKLADQVDLDEYLKQLDESRESAGRLIELGHSHPYLPKRVAALKLFASTHFFSKATGAEPPADAQSLDGCDAEVSRILSVFGGRRAARAAAAKADPGEQPAEPADDTERPGGGDDGQPGDPAKE